MEETFELGDFGIDDEDDFQTPNNEVEGLVAPSIGMSFETIDEARKYYEEFGRQNGFWIHTRTLAKARNWSDEVSNVLFVCVKEGKHVAWTKKDGVMEENHEGETDESVKLKKELEVVQLSDVNAKLSYGLSMTNGVTNGK